MYLKDFGTTGVDKFVSLGSPHQPPPAGILDQTRGILTYCADTMPGAFHSEVREHNGACLANCCASEWTYHDRCSA